MSWCRSNVTTVVIIAVLLRKDVAIHWHWNYAAEKFVDGQQWLTIFVTLSRKKCRNRKRESSRRCLQRFKVETICHKPTVIVQNLCGCLSTDNFGQAGTVYVFSRSSNWFDLHKHVAKLSQCVWLCPQHNELEYHTLQPRFQSKIAIHDVRSIQQRQQSYGVS